MAQQDQYVQIPKDFNDIRQKFIFNLTKRQVISFSIGAMIGLPVFFLLKSRTDLSAAIISMGICASPAIFCGIYKRNGLYFEKIIKNMFRFFRSPRKRVYRTMNVYKSIDMQIESYRLQRILLKAERKEKH